MKKQLNNILLIDDSNADNFLAVRTIRKAGITNSATVKTSGQEALDFLNSCKTGDATCPDMIFLDINMPGMNGWEFLDAYQRLDEDTKATIVIIMVTTSHAQSDKDKAAKYDVLCGFEHKPITVEKLIKIMEVHFPEYTKSV